MSNKPSLSITTICHPPYIRFLEKHLLSIKRANEKFSLPIFLLNVSTQKSEESKINEIVSKIGINDINLINTSENLPIGRSRNVLFDSTSTDWVLFTDTDTVMDKYYIENFANSIGKLDKTKLGAISGMIGAEYNTNLGEFEAVSDIVSLLNKIKNIDKDSYKEFSISVNEIGIEKSLQHLNNNLLKYEGREIRYLQGFNQIIHKDIRAKYGGFDDVFVSAEDREIAAKIQLNDYKIRFLPKCKINHLYDFTIEEICIRKYTHGVWSEKFRKKYEEYPEIVKQTKNKKWLSKNEGYRFDMPDLLMKNIIRSNYFKRSLIAYILGCMHSKNVI